jgi:hypothetical protein
MFWADKWLPEAMSNAAGPLVLLSILEMCVSNVPYYTFPATHQVMDPSLLLISTPPPKPPFFPVNLTEPASLHAPRCQCVSVCCASTACWG